MNTTFSMSKSEFDKCIEELVRAGLIEEWEDEGVTYYNSTLKSTAFIGKPYDELKKWVNAAIKALPAIVNVITLIAKAQ